MKTASLLVLFQCLIPASVSWAQEPAGTDSEVRSAFEDSIESMKFTPSGMLQIWGRATDSTGNLQSPLQKDQQSRGILVRRAEFGMGESRGMGLEWRFMIDLTKSPLDENGNPAGDRKILQDLYGGWEFDPSFKLRIGQFHIPTGLEGLQPSGELLFPERSWLGWRLGDKRDAGVAGSGRVGSLRYEVASFNGQGNNSDPGQNMRESAARISWELDTFALGGWYDNVSAESSFEAKSSSGVDFKAIFGKLRLQGEYASLWAASKQSGSYLSAGYSVSELSQLAIRFDSFTDYFQGDSQETAGDLAYSRYLSPRKQVRLQMSLRSGNQRIKENSNRFTLGILALQISF